jgi:hypothetical protein
VPKAKSSLFKSEKPTTKTNSTIFSQIQALAFEHTIDILKERLSELYRTAAENEFVRRDGTGQIVLVVVLVLAFEKCHLYA